jgi:Rieske Fe-S protein
VPAPANLAVPPYKFLDDARIMIGVNPEGAA